MKCSYENIEKLVLHSVAEINETLEQQLPIAMKGACPLFGGKGMLDSIALVTLIVNLEQRIEDALGASVILASAKAMSQRNSPFLSVASLAHFCSDLIREKESV